MERTDSMPDEKPKGTRLECEKCPLRSGQIALVEQSTAALYRRVNIMENKCDGRKMECYPIIQSKVSWKVFWGIVVTFVGISGAVFAFLSSELHENRTEILGEFKDLSTEFRETNKEIVADIRTISADVKVIKSKIENGR